MLVTTFVLVVFTNLLLVLSVYGTDYTICASLKQVDNAFVKINYLGTSPDSNVTVEVICENEYDLEGNATFFCEHGKWPDNVYFVCHKRCASPPYLNNSVLTLEGVKDQFDYYQFGARATYTCNEGYHLSSFDNIELVCRHGTWNGHYNNCTRKVKMSTCSSPMNILNGYFMYEKTNDFGRNRVNQIIHYKCDPGYTLYGDQLHQCLSNGKWFPGTRPSCGPAIALECASPPQVPYAIVYNLNQTDFQSTFTTKFPVKSQISYQCLPGYALQGNEILMCTIDGSWWPTDPPVCYKESGNYYFEVNSINAVLISAATGAGVLGLLLIICLIAVCRRSKPFTRAVSIPTPVQRSSLGDHATLLHHPDRLALIAFADGFQNEQAILPSYDEATRGREPITMAVTRLHRSHWPNMPSRRIRNGQMPEMIHVTRQGSFVSHTPSIRSGGDSMGSTDTVAMSEGSTNVTLDTVSSHSGSQPASCRVHCGSLASFDTNSVVNTEGVPLLEENELEEVSVGDASLTIDTHPISDNGSYKLSIASGDIR